VATDEIPVELSRCVKDDNLDKLVNLCDSIYDCRRWPDEFTKTVMIPIPIKQGTNKCTEHRSISLITHTAKIMLKFMNRPLVTKMQENVGKEQFGFRRGTGTRDATGLIRIIGNIYRGKTPSVYVLQTWKRPLRE